MTKGFVITGSTTSQTWKSNRRPKGLFLFLFDGLPWLFSFLAAVAKLSSKHSFRGLHFDGSAMASFSKKLNTCEIRLSQANSSLIIQQA